jgi:hypothetical protein
MEKISRAKPQSTAAFLKGFLRAFAPLRENILGAQTHFSTIVQGRHEFLSLMPGDASIDDIS